MPRILVKPLKNSKNDFATSPNFYKAAMIRSGTTVADGIKWPLMSTKFQENGLHVQNLSQVILSILQRFVARAYLVLLGCFLHLPTTPKKWNDTMRRWRNRDSQKKEICSSSQFSGSSHIHPQLLPSAFFPSNLILLNHNNLQFQSEKNVKKKSYFYYNRRVRNLKHCTSCITARKWRCSSTTMCQATADVAGALPRNSAFVPLRLFFYAIQKAKNVHKSCAWLRKEREMIWGAQKLNSHIALTVCF